MHVFTTTAWLRDCPTCGKQELALHQEGGKRWLCEAVRVNPDRRFASDWFKNPSRRHRCAAK